MAKPSDERNSVISNLRACLISSQGGIRMDSLNKDYMQIIGEYIPFKRLGFNQLEEFLKSIPEISVNRKGPDVYIEAKESQTSAHVTKLVSKQKRSGKKRYRSNRNIPPRNFRGTAPRFIKRIYKAPLITTPVYSPQKQCYLPLKISVPQNNNTINYNARVVSEVNRTSNKSNSYSMPANQTHTSIMDRPSLVSPKNIKPLMSIPPLVPNGKASLNTYSESSTKNDVMFRNGSSLSPPLNNLNSFKDNSLVSPGDQIGYVSTPAPHEEPSKKVKQLAQDRLEKVRKNKLLVTVSLQQGESTSPYQRQLTAYLQERGWEEASYKILNENSGKRVCYCTLSIFIPRMAPNLAPEVIDCGTFPNDFYNVNEAKECVAKQALEKLKKREIYNTFPIVHNPSVILQRVERMVKEKDTGKWASKIEDEHRTLFKEILPPHWLNVVHASDQFVVEELANSSLLIKLKENAVPFQIVPVDSTIPKLVLPEENTWDVFVTRAVSVTGVCIRFIGDDYSGLLDSLTSDMESWYSQKEHLVNPFLVVGEYYASYCNESWARVLVLKINIDNIHVKFIDHGDDDVLPRSVLYRLEPKFMSLPPQAIAVSLKNLENYKNHKEAPDYLLTNIVGSCLVAVVEQRTPTISVTLFDTSNEEAVNLNEKLKYLFNYNYKEKVEMEEGGVFQASVSYIDESGGVYIQFISETLSILFNQMDYIEDGSYEKYRIKDYSQLYSDKVYLLDQNNEKHRVKIIKATSLNGQVLVSFIDSGGEDSVFVEDLYNLEDISYLLSQIPPQAITIKLHEVNPQAFTPEKMARLKELLLGESVVAKIRKIENGVPAVEFFKRTIPENLMVSINQTLILDNALKNVVNRLEHISFKSTPRTEPCVQKNILQQISNNFPSGSIERRIAENRPILPEIGEEFQILVQQTANPSCIMIQPLDYVNVIQNLEKEMCEFYNNLKPGLDSNIKEGTLCAVRDKSCWYRAHVDKVIDSESVSVRLLDYGSLSLVLNTDIRPLNENFTKVPYVGFCCKISGIAAKHGDWNVEDCLETRVLIDHRKLLAQIKGVHLSQSSLGGTILELQLFDMNSMTGSKVDVGDVLIQKGCAIREERKI